MRAACLRPLAVSLRSRSRPPSAASACRQRMRSMLARYFLRRGKARCRKARREAAALARRAIHAQHGLVARKRVLDDRQPQPGAARFARAATVDAVEALREPRQVLRIDADAGI